MASVVGICNRALDLLGADPIASLEDPSKPARLCARNFGAVRDAVLRAYPWNCALRRASLPALAAAPAWGFARAFVLPEGPEPPYCLRLWRLEQDDDLPYRIEGRRVVTDRASPLNILYIARLEEAGELDALAAEAVAARLAVYLSANLTETASRTQAMTAYYQATMAEARTADAQEGSADFLTGSTWLESRYW